MGEIKGDSISYTPGIATKFADLGRVETNPIETLLNVLFHCSYNTFPDKLNEEYFARVEAQANSTSQDAFSETPTDSDAASSRQNNNVSSTWTIAIARRSRQEVRAAQRTARDDRASPKAWAKCLLSHVVSLWFVHSPAFVKNSESRATKNVRLVHDVMVALLNSDFVRMEEVSFLLPRFQENEQ